MDALIKFLIILNIFPVLALLLYTLVRDVLLCAGRCFGFLPPLPPSSSNHWSFPLPYSPLSSSPFSSGEARGGGGGGGGSVLWMVRQRQAGSTGGTTPAGSSTPLPLVGPHVSIGIGRDFRGGRDGILPGATSAASGAATTGAAASSSGCTDGSTTGSSSSSLLTPPGFLRYSAHSASSPMQLSADLV